MIQIILSIRFELVREGVFSHMNHWFWLCVKSRCNLFDRFSGGYVGGVIWLGGFCNV